MVFVGDPWWTDAIAGRILEERMWQCKTMPAGTVTEFYASQSRISASAAGAACT